MQAHLESLRRQMTECEELRNQASDGAKRELFDNLARHFNVLASQVERVMAEKGAADALPGSKTHESFPGEEE